MKGRAIVMEIFRMLYVIKTLHCSRGQPIWLLADRHFYLNQLERKQKVKPKTAGFLDISDSQAVLLRGI